MTININIIQENINRGGFALMIDNHSISCDVILYDKNDVWVILRSFEEKINAFLANVMKTSCPDNTFLVQHCKSFTEPKHYKVEKWGNWDYKMPHTIMLRLKENK